MPIADREKRRKYVRDHYARNREAQRARIAANNRRYRDAIRAWVDEYFSTHPCADCGESDRIVLEFDHVRGEKKFNIGDAARTYVSVKTLAAEVEKCEVRCANCHRRRTYFARLAAE